MADQAPPRQPMQSASQQESLLKARQDLMNLVELRLPEFDPLKVRGPNFLLAGMFGTGKTYSTTTLLEAGLEVAYLFTEPGGEDSVIDAVRRKGLPMDKIFFKYVPASNPTWDSFMNTLDTVNRYTYEQLTQLKQGINTHEYKQFIDVVAACRNFKCDLTGEELGPVDYWPNNRCLILDGMSGLNIMAQENHVGARPTLHEGDWNVAMNTEEKLIYKLCFSTRCWFVLIAHVTRNQHELTGALNYSVDALGRKLAPKLGRFFGDCIHAYREETRFYWSTITYNYDLKFRLLPAAKDMPQDFKPAVEAWLKRYELNRDEWLEQREHQPELSLEEGS